MAAAAVDLSVIAATLGSASMTTLTTLNNIGVDTYIAELRVKLNVLDLMHSQDRFFLRDTSVERGGRPLPLSDEGRTRIGNVAQGTGNQRKIFIEVAPREAGRRFFPTAEQMIRENINARKEGSLFWHFQNAWNESFVEGGKMIKEQGGFIYGRPSRVGDSWSYLVARIPENGVAGISWQKTISRTEKNTGMSTRGFGVPADTPGSKPPGDDDATNPAWLIAIFHTHPANSAVTGLMGETGPSEGDKTAAGATGIPEFVVGSTGLWLYGPDAREGNRDNVSTRLHYPRTTPRALNSEEQPRRMFQGTGQGLWRPDFPAGVKVLRSEKIARGEAVNASDNDKP